MKLFRWTCAGFIAWFATFNVAEGQCTSVDFDLPATLCRDQTLRISAAATYNNYEWDFCAGDFENPASASVLLPSAGSAFNIELVEVAGNYYGFYFSRDFSKLFRLDFGTDPNSTPVTVDLGSIGGTAMLSVEVVKQGAEYIGFGIDFTNKLYRFEFGTSITSVPLPAELIYDNNPPGTDDDNLLVTPIDMKAVEDESGKYLFIANLNANKVTRFFFASDYNVAALSLAIDQFTVTGSGGLSGLSFIRDCSSWYAVSTSLGGGQVTRIQFGGGLADGAPACTTITGLAATPSSPAGISLAYENASYYALIQTRGSQSDLYRINFGGAMSNAVVESANLGNFGVLFDIFGFSAYKIGSKWLLFSSENSAAKVFKIAFEDKCLGTSQTSGSKTNDIQTTSAGTFQVSLSVTGANGVKSGISKSTIVSSLVAADISIQTQNICAQHDVLLTYSSVAGGVTSVEWDFGDLTSTSPVENPTHVYAAAGEYEIRLDAVASNTCGNTAFKNIKVYDAPIAAFTVPPGLMCTGNEFTFVNNTPDVYDGHLAYAWDVANDPTSTQRDLEYTFPNTTDTDIKLTVSIPGCADDEIKTITGLQTGPTVGFDVTGQCEDVVVTFTNTSTGSIASYLWDFGNGDTSTALNESRTFSTIGTYPVILQSIGTNSCVSTLQKDVAIYTKPSADFSLDLPPLSCSGTPSQFHNTTPGPTDSNLQSWTWSFGDGGSAAIEDPTHIYALHGDYSVGLTVGTNKGCSGQVTKDVVISESPVATFSNTVPCVDKQVQFTAGPSATANAWHWEIDNVVYNQQNPVHTFAAAGSYSALLKLTAANNCEGTVTESILVPVVPAIDIAIVNPYAVEAATVSAAVTGSTDLASGYLWDFGDGQTGAGQTTTHSFAHAANYTVQAGITTGSGCTYGYSEVMAIQPPRFADFTITSQACKEQLVDINNMSANAVAYEWDLCAGELNNTPSATILLNNAGAPFRVEMVEGGGNYFGFFTSRGNPKLYRLDFGSDINSAPVQTDLGNLGLAAAWLNVEIVKEGNEYFGFILDFDKKVYRFSLGTSLTNAPMNVETIYGGALPSNPADNLLSNPVDLTMLEDASGKYAFIANSNDANIVRLSFGTSYNAVATTIPATATAINAGPGGTFGLSFINAEGAWYAVASKSTGTLSRLYFAGGLADVTPAVSTITGVPFTPSYKGVAAVSDNDEYYIFAQSATGLYRVSLGSSMTNSPQSSSDLGGFTLFNNVFGFSMFKAKSDWLVLSSENSGPNIYRIKFPSTCFSATTYSASAEPEVTTTNAASGSVTLTAWDASGNFSTKAGAIVVTAAVSPAIDFASENMCAGHDVVFTATGSAAITTYSWSFGDATAPSSVQNPVHQYSSAGTYEVRLDVIAGNSCSNFASDQLKIYNSPAAAFTTPTGLVCTNNTLVFVNNTPDNFDGHLTFNWFVDSTPAGTARDLHYSFSGTGDHQVKLVAQIPGCAEEEIQNLIGVASGPAVTVAVSGNCESQAIGFTSQTVGAVSGYLWDFGDGTTATGADAQHQFPRGAHTVQLEVTSPNTCVTSVSTSVPVYSSPAPTFSLDLPPFSCAGTPSQFHDMTPAMDDSNIQSWAWSMGDGSNVQGKDPTHIYALHGSYSVGLTVMTDKGCSGQTTRTISISESPAAEFSNTVACVGKQVQFTAGETPSAKAWQWKIDNVTYQQKNPVHTFSASGSHTAQLTVTATNNCASVITKAIPVPVVPVIDIVIDNACAGQQATLSAVSTGSSDPASGYLWDFGGGQTAQGQTTSRNFFPAGNFPAQVEVTAASGCVYKHSEILTIHPVPITSFTPAEEYGPSPLTVDFHNTSTGAGTYRWRFADDLGWSSTEQSPEYTYTALGTYHVTMEGTSAAGCSSTSSGTVHVIVPFADLSVQEFTLYQDPATHLTKAALQVMNKGNYPISTVQFSIDLGSGLVLTETVAGNIAPQAVATLITNSSLTFQQGGTGFVCITASIPNDENTADNKQCISGDVSTKLFEPYPNPSNGSLSVQVISFAEDELSIQIVNATGGDAYSKKVGVHEGLNVLELDLSILSSGIYTIRLISPSTGTVTSRLVIQR